MSRGEIPQEQKQRSRSLEEAEGSHTIEGEQREGDQDAPR
jgi:hypothetical protein